MTAITSTAYSRDLGDELRRIREKFSPLTGAGFLKWRMERQAILKRPSRRPECLFYVHELALQLQVGDDRIMEEQYLRMLFNTHILRIVPMSAGPAAIRNSARMLFSFEKLVPVAYSETDLAMVFAHDGQAIAQSRVFFKWLDALALDEGESRSLLANYVSGLRKDPHDPRAELA